MVITLEKRTADSVRTYFEKADRPEIKQVLPQKAKRFILTLVMIKSLC